MAAPPADPAGYREIRGEGFRLAVPRRWGELPIEAGDLEKGLDELDLPESVKRDVRQSTTGDTEGLQVVDTTSTATSAGTSKAAMPTSLHVTKQPGELPDIRGAKPEFAAALRSGGLRDVRTEIVEVNGQEVLRATGEIPVKGSTGITSEQYLFPSDGGVYILTFSTDRPREYRERIANIVRTFRVTE